MPRVWGARLGDEEAQGVLAVPSRGVLFDEVSKEGEQPARSTRNPTLAPTPTPGPTEQAWPSHKQSCSTRAARAEFVVEHPTCATFRQVAVSGDANRVVRGHRLPVLTDEAASYALEISGERVPGAVAVIQGLFLMSSGLFEHEEMVETIRLGWGVHIKVGTN